MNFKEMHAQETPLVIGNVWDVPSAKTAEKLDFKAIGTSSSAVAGMLGYNDGEEMTFSELEYIVGRIAASTNLPLSVDLESGYSRNPNEIVDNIKRLVNLGVVGINLEDSVMESSRQILRPEVFAKKLSEVKEQLERDKVEVFINVRTDAFLLGQDRALEESIKRIGYYEEAGADGIFTPCIQEVSDITSIANSTKLPVNVMCMPELPDFTTLSNIGVKRISMGNFIFDNMYAYLEKVTGTIVNQKSFKAIF